MSPVLSGALGALAVLFAAGLLRRAVGSCHAHGLHGRGRRMPLRFLYRRLRTRPDQEKVISGEAEALAEEVRSLRADLRSVRDELADLLAAPTLDAAAIQAAVDARLARIGAIRTRLTAALTTLHATLDPAQRATLAELIRHGPHHAHRHAHG